MFRSGKHLFGRLDFDHRAKIEYCDAITDGLHDGQIVAYEQIGQAESGLQVGQQVQDLSLQRHVQSRNRLIEDQDARGRAKTELLRVRLLPLRHTD